MEYDKENKTVQAGDSQQQEKRIGKAGDVFPDILDGQQQRRGQYEQEDGDFEQDVSQGNQSDKGFARGRGQFIVPHIQAESACGREKDHICGHEQGNAGAAQDFPKDSVADCFDIPGDQHQHQHNPEEKDQGAEIAQGLGLGQRKPHTADQPEQLQVQ